MDITVDTGENKVVVHIEKYKRSNSFAVIMNYETGTTVKASLDDLIKALEIISGKGGSFSKSEERANNASSGLLVGDGEKPVKVTKSKKAQPAVSR